MNYKLYKQLINNLPVGYAYHKIILDDSGNPADYEFLEVNPAFEKFTGLSSSNLINKKITDVIPGFRNDKFDWIKFYGNIAINGGETELEQFFQPFNKWYKINVSSPEKFYFVTVFVDITKEKNELNELDNFFSVNLDLLCIADVEGNFIKINKEWEKILGYPESELMKKKFIDFIHPDDLEKTFDAISQLKNENEVLNFVNRYRCIDGTYRYLEWKSVPFKNLIYAAARDITLSKMSQLEYNGIINTTKDGFWISDLHGQIIDVNNSYCEMTGYAKDELLNLNISDIEAVENPEEIEKQKRIKKILSEGFDRFETKHKKKTAIQ
ncbi:PAS domain S-box protein [Candidatus Dependentiae bacterium]|nr:PAS domain S-box protein [Candidatus Dependentiae bacterium]